MCKRKPLPRCRRHTATRLDSAMRRRDVAFETVKRMQTNKAAPSRLQLAISRAEAADQRWMNAQYDWDATPEGLSDLERQLADDTLTAKVRAGLEHRRTCALFVRQARRDHASMMPPPPAGDADKTTRDAYTRLGSLREELAYFDTRLAAGTQHPSPQQVEQRVRLENEVFAADGAYRMLAAGGTPERKLLTTDEAMAMVTGSPEDARAAALNSHLRASLAVPGAHPTRLRETLSDREKSLGVRIREANPALPAARTSTPPPIELPDPPAPELTPPPGRPFTAKDEGWVQSMSRMRRRNRPMRGNNTHLIDDVVVAAGDSVKKAARLLGGQPGSQMGQAL